MFGGVSDDAEVLGDLSVSAGEETLHVIKQLAHEVGDIEHGARTCK